MEDQGKRMLLAVVVAFGILFLWQLAFPPEMPPQKDEVPAESKAGSEDNGTASLGQSAETGSAGQTQGAPKDGQAPKAATPETPRGPEQFFDFSTNSVRARFSSYGGSLVSWELLNDQFFDASTKQPEQLVRVQTPEHRDLRVWFEHSTYDIPEDAEWKGEKVADDVLVFVWENGEVRVTKELKLYLDNYLVEMKVSFELLTASSAKQALAMSLYSSQAKDVESSSFSTVTRAWKSACFYEDEIHTKSAKSLRKSGRKEYVGAVNWGGFAHAYFLTAVALKGTPDLTKCARYPLTDVEGGMGIDFVQRSVELKKGDPTSLGTFIVYLGPKYQTHLAQPTEIVGVDSRFDGAVDFGWFGFIGAPLLALLRFFQSWVVNWGIAIVLLTIVVKGLTLPWTHKSMKSMKAMAKLRPQLEKIKEKYSDDRVRQNTETMALFKAHKVNPMLGCLPMFLQMPIWFALYRTLGVAGELYQAPFVPGWVDDLTLPDPYYLLPVLLTGMMFLQTKLTPTTGTGAQQKFLTYGMPIMFGGMSFMFPSGLTVYILTNTLFTAIHHLYLHRTDPTPPPAPTKSVAEVATPATKQNDTGTNKPKSKKSKKGKKR